MPVKSLSSAFYVYLKLSLRSESEMLRSVVSGIILYDSEQVTVVNAHIYDPITDRIA